MNDKKVSKEQRDIWVPGSGEYIIPVPERMNDKEMDRASTEFIEENGDLRVVKEVDDFEVAMKFLSFLEDFYLEECAGFCRECEVKKMFNENTELYFCSVCERGGNNE